MYFLRKVARNIGPAILTGTFVTCPKMAVLGQKFWGCVQIRDLTVYSSQNVGRQELTQFKQIFTAEFAFEGHSQ